MAVGKKDYEALLRFRNAIRRYSRFTDEGARMAGLTPQQHQLLLAIKGQEDRAWASVSEIATSLQIKHHTAGGLVDRSVKAGLVQRATSSIDRRIVEVTLTEKGEIVLGRLSERNLAELRALRSVIDLPK